MAEFCLSNCGGSIQNPPVSYYDPCAVYQRPSGIQNIIYLPCNYQFTDILDPTEWSTAKTAGQIQVSPPGIFTRSVTAGASYDTDDCGGKAQENDVFSLAVETYYADPAMLDARYFADLVARRGSLHFIWVTCAGLFYVNRSWFDEIIDKQTNGGAATIAGSTPGYQVAFSQRPIEGPSTNDATKTSWQYTLEWEAAEDPFPVTLPGVMAALAA